MKQKGISIRLNKRRKEKEETKDYTVCGFEVKLVFQEISGVPSPHAGVSEHGVTDKRITRKQSSFGKQEKGNTKEKYPQVKSGLNDSTCVNKKFPQKEKKGILFLSLKRKVLFLHNFC